jgi:hypothetical protein
MQSYKTGLAHNPIQGLDYGLTDQLGLTCINPKWHGFNFFLKIMLFMRGPGGCLGKLSLIWVFTSSQISRINFQPVSI